MLCYVQYLRVQSFFVIYYNVGIVIILLYSNNDHTLDGLLYMEAVKDHVLNMLKFV